MDAIRIGIDLAKNVFSLHWVSANGKVVLRRRASREKPVELLAVLTQRLLIIDEIAYLPIDRVIATAILDRLLHHAVTLNIRGNSYRLKEKLKASLVRPEEAEA